MRRLRWTSWKRSGALPELARTPLVGSVVGSMTIGVIIFILLLSFAPDAVPFSSNNYGWNGLHQVSSTYSIHPITSLSAATVASGSVLLVIAPTKNFSQSEANIASNFVAKGGTLLIADRSGISNTLLDGMGISISIEGNIVRDSLYNWKSPDLPIAVRPTGISQEYVFLANVTGLALDTPSALSITSSVAIPVGLSSSNSEAYQVSGSSLSTGKAEQRGPIALVAVEKLGLGQVIVIGDSTFFTNSVWTNADNQRMMKNLFVNSTVYLDTSHWPQNIGESLKAKFLNFYSQLGSVEYRYLFTAGIVVASIAVLPVFSRALESKSRNITPKSESRYDEKILSRIRKDREKYGTKSE